MGEVLATFVYDIDPAFSFFRPYFLGHIITWQPGTTVIESDNPIIVEEHIFGGYQVYLKLEDKWWEYDNRSYHLLDMIVDYYAIEPITGLHVSNGVVTVGLGFSPAVGYYWLNFQYPLVSNSQFFPLPSVDEEFWFSPLK